MAKKFLNDGLEFGIIAADFRCIDMGNNAEYDIDMEEDDMEKVD